jgi:hypothetical protein
LKSNPAIYKLQAIRAAGMDAVDVRELLRA